MNELLLPERFVNALEDVKSTLKSEKKNFSEVRLFGSCANGKYVATSDVDILILTKNVLQSREKRGHFRELIDNALCNYQLNSDVVFYTVHDYDNDDSKFTKNLHLSYLLLKGEE